MFNFAVEWARYYLNHKEDNMEIKRMTDIEIRSWWTNNKRGMSLSELDGALYFARDHGILKEPVKKWRWIIARGERGLMEITDDHYSEYQVGVCFGKPIQRIDSTEIEE
jgi:hypothetical protein